MIRQSIRKAHVLDFFDPVFAAFPPLDIEAKVNFPGVLLWQVTHHMARVEAFPGAFHLGVTSLWLMPTVGLVAMGDEMLVFKAMLNLQVVYGFLSTLYLTFQHLVSGQTHHKIQGMLIG